MTFQARSERGFHPEGFAGTSPVRWLFRYRPRFAYATLLGVGGVSVQEVMAASSTRAFGSKALFSCSECRLTKPPVIAFGA